MAIMGISFTSASEGNADKTGSVVVYAGAGFSELGDDLVKAFNEKYPNIEVNMRYGGSGELFTTMETQKSGDVFFPAAYKYMDEAIENGYVKNDTVKNVTKNIPVIIVQPGNPKNITDVQDLARSDVKVGLGEAKGPDIILMDEPFSALDVTTQAKLTSLIKDIGVEYKTTFLHVTHNFNDVWNLADKVGVMKNGVLHQLDYINKVFSKPANDFVASFVGVNNIFDGEIVNTKQNSVTVKLNDNIQIQSTDDEYCHLASHEVIGENVLVAIRPENIIFAKSTFESSARNQLKGKITKIEESGPIVNVETMWRELFLKEF